MATGSFRQRGCKCPPERKRCTCGAKWYYRYDIIDPTTGRRKQKETKGFKTKAEAEKEAKRIQYELEVGTYVEEKDITFEDFVGDWLEYYGSTRGVKISTVRMRKYELSLLSAYFRHLKLKDITRKQYQDALNELKKRGFAESTLINVHGTGRMFFERAMEMEIIKSDPTEYAAIPRTQRTLIEIEEQEIPKYLEKEELSHFLSIIPDHGVDIRDYVVFLTLAYTGMRIGELLALKWSDIDFDEQTISITKTYHNPDNITDAYLLLPPKTKKSKRIITVEKIVLDEMTKYKQVQNEVKMKYRTTYHDENFVFTQLSATYAGYPIYTRLIRFRLERLLKIAGIEKPLTPHSFRHTHTSLLAEAGVSLEQIMERLGHTNDTTTKAIYLHITKPKRKEASKKFGKLMNKVSNK